MNGYNFCWNSCLLRWESELMLLIFYHWLLIHNSCIAQGCCTLDRFSCFQKIKAPREYNFQAFVLVSLCLHFLKNKCLKLVVFWVNFSYLQNNLPTIDGPEVDFSSGQPKQCWSGLISWVLFPVLRLPF